MTHKMFWFVCVSRNVQFNNIQKCFPQRHFAQQNHFTNTYENLLMNMKKQQKHLVIHRPGYSLKLRRYAM